MVTNQESAEANVGGSGFSQISTSLNVGAGVKDAAHFSLRVAEVPSVTSYDIAKRLADLLLSGVALLFLLPVFVVTAFAVTLTSAGPVLFKQRRMGRYGRSFWCYKFRSMRVDAEEILRQDTNLQKAYQENCKIVSDPRVTRVGKLIRKTSLDELPQFINVFIGDMSIVGPRPILEHELQKYGKDAEVLLSVKPGLAGLWQASGRSNISYSERVKLDLHYARQRSTALDIKLFLKSVWATLRSHGAH